MTKSLTVLLLATACVGTAYAAPNNSDTKIVTTKQGLLNAVSSNSHYTTVVVQGVINDLNNVELKDGLTLRGMDEKSGLKAATDAPLLTVGKNNTIKHLILTQNSYWEPRAIHNNGGSGVGNLVIDHVKTNGAIDIALGDASTDSKLTLTHNTIHLDPYSATTEDLTAGILLTVENKSQMEVEDVSFNDITSIASINMGIYNRAYEGGTIDYKGGLTHNTVNTQQQYSIGFYNYAEGGNIKIEGVIKDNNVIINAINTQPVYNHANKGGNIDISGGYQNNQLNAKSALVGTGFYLKAEDGSHISIGAIAGNHITANAPGSIPFYTSATEGSHINLAGAAIKHNVFEAGYPTMVAVLNNAFGAGSMVDFGLGSTDAVLNAFTTHNTLIANEDVGRKVSNDVENGGVIQ
jgi:hypothetical protein